MNTVSYDDVSFDTESAPWASWSKPGADGRVKTFFSNGKRLRLLELPAGFDEAHWCTVGHQGFVFEGCFTIIFDDRTFECRPGTVFSIPDGVRHRSRGAADGQTLVFVVDDQGDQAQR
ncbi:cupin domain-containing protein [Burkholderia ubonensis]|uniref:Cupin n=1 Tax=Burkholderia ubonensis subsp. mesacidophila TaxID=265293 RepID=A0A2A4FCZ9_9BURK|nr:cupin [Burkholderia ubonensis]PCE30209.1 cupin [Burkholderia ubonensis subsp. mesacidophila]